MLRITSEQREGVRVLSLEGKLVGAWVDELRRCWSSARGSSIRIELADVGFVDGAGKALLAEMVRDGVEIVARGCLATAIRDEIVTAAANSRDH